jgi:hypothetical protein
MGQLIRKRFVNKKEEEKHFTPRWRGFVFLNQFEARANPAAPALTTTAPAL